jgi:hypothetical protein
MSDRRKPLVHKGSPSGSRFCGAILELDATEERGDRLDLVVGKM